MRKGFPRRLLLPALLALGSALLPVAAPAQVFPASANPCCRSCGRPPSVCTCTTFEPVVRTRYRKVRSLSWQNVSRTEYRCESHCEMAPVTRLRNVVVDEGGYRMVWVPKPVVRTVAERTYRPRITRRIVPYTVTKRVPRVRTHVVPQHRIDYVPHTSTYTVPPEPTGCCGSAGTSFRRAAPPSMSRLSANNGPTLADPPSALGEPTPALPESPASFVAGEPDYGAYEGIDGDSWSTGSHFDSAETSASDREPGASFRPPSAARVWQSRGSVVR